MRGIVVVRFDRLARGDDAGVREAARWKNGALTIFKKVQNSAARAAGMGGVMADHQEVTVGRVVGPLHRANPCMRHDLRDRAGRAQRHRLKFAVSADAEPSRYHWLVPRQLLFVMLPACVVLIDPASQAVAEIVTAPASTTGSAPAPTGSQAR
jgi:hypothetical protein